MSGSDLETQHTHTHVCMYKHADRAICRRQTDGARPDETTNTHTHFVSRIIVNSIEPLPASAPSSLLSGPFFTPKSQSPQRSPGENTVH